jgi:RNA recognition motif-containing protein
MKKLQQIKVQTDLQNSKADRKIYVGNLPHDITTQQVKPFFFIISSLII